MKKPLLLTVLLFSVILNGICQAPTITYPSPQSYNTGTPISPITPTNTGGAMPGITYALVSTLAGNGTSGSINATGATASFYNPKATALDAAGNIYVADMSNNKIRKVTPDGTVTTLAGSGTANYADGTGASASFNTPQGIAIDAAGNVFVADTYNNRIRKITPLGVVTTFAGSGSLSSFNGTGTIASFNYPVGLVFDKTGNLYVTETGGRYIRKITSAAVVTTIAGTGIAGSTNGTGTLASFNSPSAITIDLTGNLYVADSGNNLIRKITSSGIVSTFAGSGTAGAANGIGTAASFYTPSGITIDVSGNLYVADQLNDQIRMISPAGVVTSIAGIAGLAQLKDGIGTSAFFSRPAGMATDGQGNVFIADYTGHAIRKMNITGYTVTPALPSGLVLNSLSGVISGSPSAITPATDYAITAANASGNSTAVINIATIIPTTPPNPLGASVLLARVVSNIISVTGTNFYNITGVTVNGTPALSYTVNTSTSLYVSIPGNITSGAIAITNNYGTGTVNNFKMQPPQITYNTQNPYTSYIPAADLFPINTGGSVLSSFYAQIGGIIAGTGSVGSANGLNVSSTFNGPTSVAADAAGFFYIADQNNNLIRQFSPQGGYITTLAGSGTSGSADGTGTAASFNSPTCIVTDAYGNFFIADYGNNKIRKVTPAGVVTTFVGSGVIGAVNGTGAAASFKGPVALTFDIDGNMYVADALNYLVRKITPAGVVSTFAGSGIQGTANGTGTAASFSSLSGIAADISGNVYVTDGNQIRIISPGGVVSSFAGSAVSGSANGAGTAASFNRPQGLSIDFPGNIYVADMGNNQIRLVSPAGLVSTLANPTSTASYYNSPTGVAIDGRGTLYIANKGGNVINTLPITGYTISGSLPVGFTFSYGYISGMPRSAFPPTSVSVTAYNNVGSYTTTVTLSAVDLGKPAISYTSPTTLSVGVATSPLTPTNTGGQVFSNYIGYTTTYAGTGLQGSSNGTATTASFFTPQGLATDIAGNLYVADSFNNLIRKITPTGNVTTLAGSGTAGYTNGTGTAASFSYPLGLATDAADNVYVTDYYNGKIRKITPTGVVSTLTATNFSSPSAITVDATGNVFVSDASNMIRKITPSGVVTTFAGNGATGSANGAGTVASFNIITGLAFDSDGNLYACERGNNLIRKITPAGVVSTLAGSGTARTGDGIGTAASFYSPVGMGIDAANNIYVADGSGNAARKITPAGVVTTISGRQGYGGNHDGPGSIATLDSPLGLAVDELGNLYVSDGSNYTIRKVATMNGYSISPTLPSGLSFDVNTGIISGTPTAAFAPTDFTVTASNPQASSTTTLNLSILLAQSFTFNPLTAVNYGSADFAPGAVSSANVPVTYTSSNTAVATIINGNIHIVGAGNTIITASSAGNSSYGAAIATQNLTVNQIPLTITADNKTQKYGDSTPILTATYTGFANGDDASKLATLPVLSTTSVAVGSVAGTYPIKASGAVSGNYIFTYTNGTLTVSPASLTITADDKSRNYGAANPTLTVKYAGFVNGDDASKLTTQPTISTTATVTSAGGIYPISISGAASANYIITYTSGTLTVIPVPVVSSISPTTAAAGTTVTITGVNFTGATAVSFGGTAASFNVVSSTVIFAVVGSGSSGNVLVTTPLGTSSIAGFNFIPVPVITASGSTTFSTGGSVTLSATSIPGYSYQWLKDGVNISGANASTYTATQSGSYTLNLSYNGVGQLSAATVVTNVFTLPATNFTLVVNSATCKGSANGVISITSAQNLNYTATITGNGSSSIYNFNTTATINNLAAGTYNICFTVAGQNAYQQCFTIIITEPKDLALYAAVNKVNNTVTLSLTGGDTYKIDLNGVMTTTTSSTITLDLPKANNIVKVSTDKICQGVIEQQFDLSENLIAYPNPFINTINIKIGSSVVPLAMVSVYNANGFRILSQQFVNRSGYVTLDLSNLSMGIYIVKLITDKGENLFKILKK